MKVNVPLIDSSSKIYIYTPTVQGRELYLYPLCTGCYQYLPGYRLERDYYPGYTLILIEDGECEFRLPAGSVTANTGSIVLINGYEPHAYHTENGFAAHWIHFDGIMAGHFYNAITRNSKNKRIPGSLPHIEKLLLEIYDIFDKGYRIRESLISRNITDILTELLEDHEFASENEEKIHESIRYMNRHLKETITVRTLAQQVYMSSYYFIHRFKQVTGYSPHDYLLNLRISHAKYYLKTTQKPLAEIAGLCGFTDESSLCHTFRKRMGCSPGGYRSGGKTAMRG